MSVSSSLWESLTILRHRWGLGVVELATSAVFMGPVVVAALAAPDQVVSVPPLLLQLSLIIPAGLALAVSEAIFVVSVRDQRRDSFSWPRALRDGMQRLRSVTIVSLIGVALGTALRLLAWQIPARLFDAGWVAAAVITVVLGFVPWALLEVTRTAWLRYAIRMAVIEAREPRSAAGAALRFLHGRVATSLRVVVTSGALQLGLGVVGGLLGGLALIGLRALTAVVDLPFPWSLGVAVMVLFSVGSALLGRVLESSLWTLTFLDGRARD